MRKSKFILIALSLVMTFSACKKDEDTTGGGASTSLPEGNYVKFGSTIFLENAWYASEYTVELGDRPVTAIYFNSTKTNYFVVQFAQAPELDKTYELGTKPKGNTIAYTRYSSASGEAFIPEAGGTLTIKMIDGKKIVELQGPTASATTSATGQLNARFIWND